jgi:calcium binding protein 39
MFKHFIHYVLKFILLYNYVILQGKKDVAQVFNNVLRRQLGSRSPTVEHICAKSEILFTLIAGCVDQN